MKDQIIKVISSFFDENIESIVDDSSSWTTNEPDYYAAELYAAIESIVNAQAQDFAGWITNQVVAGRTYHKLWIDYCAEKQIDYANVSQPSTLKRKTTSRGFALYEFLNRAGQVCSIQKSSAAMEEAIWIGANEINLRHFKAGEGWKEVALPDSIEEHYVANNRMELTQEQVKSLLPILISFVENGEI